MTEPEFSIVIPCLNEARTIAKCVGKARSYMARHAIHCEIVVADNGSTDGSQRLAETAGARVLHVCQRGYGAALKAGIAAANGRFIIIGDGDDSYDFSRLDGFVEKLREGFDLVMGNRFKGGIVRGAMPLLHRYVGNPVLSFIGRLFFGAQIGDFHCGLRGFRRDSITRLKLATNGMEFASEMIVKATLARLRIGEVATTLSIDGRDRPPHLNTWRDGWRHLRFLLTYSPRWLFLYPGLTLFSIGVIVQACLLNGGVRIGPAGFDIHSMLYAAAASILGAQMMWFAVLAKTHGSMIGVLPQNARLEQILAKITLERGLLLGCLMVVGGLVLSMHAFGAWASHGYGPLDPRSMMRLTIPSVTFMLLGSEFVTASFFLGMIRTQAPALQTESHTTALPNFASESFPNSH